MEYHLIRLKNPCQCSNIQNVYFINAKVKCVIRTQILNAIRRLENLLLAPIWWILAKNGDTIIRMEQLLWLKIFINAILIAKIWLEIHLSGIGLVVLLIVLAVNLIQNEYLQYIDIFLLIWIYKYIFACKLRFIENLNIW